MRCTVVLRLGDGKANVLEGEMNLPNSKRFLREGKNHNNESQSRTGRSEVHRVRTCRKEFRVLEKLRVTRWARA